MRKIVLATAAALGLAAIAAPASAGASCEKAPEIKAAFEPRLEFERARAERVAGADAGWPAEIRRGFDEISGEGLDCRAIYDRYSAFMDDVIARTDQIGEQSKTRGVIFRKW